MEDKELKKKLAKIPDADKNGDPIYKIAEIKKQISRMTNRAKLKCALLNKVFIIDKFDALY